MVKQSRIDSIMEAATNIIIGLAVSFIANMFILPWFLGVTISVATNLGIGVAYTIVSFARSYTIRRLFNGRGVWESLKASRRATAIVTLVLSPGIILWQAARHAPGLIRDLGDEYIYLFRQAWTGR